MNYNEKWCICYLEREYKATVSDPDSFILHSKNSSDTLNGFTLYGGDIYRKIVKKNELKEAYIMKTYAKYKNYKFQVWKEDGDKILLISLIGDYRVFESLGMDMIDRGVYQKWVDKNNVTSIYEEKEPYDLN